MKIEVTDKISGKLLAIDPEKVRILEPVDGGGCHIAFDDQQGRVLLEEYADLKPFFDVVPVTAAGLKTALKLK